MSRLRARSQGLWSGAVAADVSSVMFEFGPLEEVAPDLAFIEGFANVTALHTEAGLVLFDTGSQMTAPLIAGQLQGWRARPVHTAVYTHGHVDHVMGMAAIDAAAVVAGAPRPHVIAHHAVAARFARYRLTAGWNAAINRRQFRLAAMSWPTDYRYPDQTYHDRHTVEVGGARIELHHGLGETDDHTFAWLPAQRALVTGDLFIWASPNCGNPQKVQRFVAEWADALDTMRTFAAELLLPGHGPPIFGADRVDSALADTSALLRCLHDQVVELMNQGKRLDDILAEVRIPQELLQRPFLRPIYDDPQFVLRSLWRRYGGWWDGNPARLLPPKDAAVAQVVAELSGSAAALAALAQEKAPHDPALACQLVEWAFQAAAPADKPAIAAIRAALYEQRAQTEPSLMARNIFLSAASER